MIPLSCFRLKFGYFSCKMFIGYVHPNASLFFNTEERERERKAKQIYLLVAGKGKDGGKSKSFCFFMSGYLPLVEEQGVLFLITTSNGISGARLLGPIKMGHSLTSPSAKPSRPSLVSHPECNYVYSHGSYFSSYTGHISAYTGFINCKLCSNFQFYHTFPI